MPRRLNQPRQPSRLDDLPFAEDPEIPLRALIRKAYFPWHCTVGSRRLLNTESLAGVAGCDMPSSLAPLSPQLDDAFGIGRDTVELASQSAVDHLGKGKLGVVSEGVDADCSRKLSLANPRSGPQARERNGAHLLLEGIDPRPLAESAVEDPVHHGLAQLVALPGDRRLIGRAERLEVLAVRLPFDPRRQRGIDLVAHQPAQRALQHPLHIVRRDRRLIDLIIIIG